MTQFHETRMGQQHYAMTERNLGRIAASLEQLVDLRRQILGIKTEEEERAVQDLNDEAEAVLGGGRSLFKELTPEEEEAYKMWARENFDPFSDIGVVWHPVVKAECEQINRENGGAQ